MSTAAPPWPDADPAGAHGALAQAAEWFALLRSEAATDADRARWRAWLAAHDVHRDAWQRIERVGARFDDLRAIAPAADAAVDALRAGRRAAGARRRWLGVIAALGVGSAAAWLAAWRGARAPALPAVANGAGRVWTVAMQTAPGELREVTLPDGTHVWLDAATAIDVRFDADARRITLATGRVLVTSGGHAAADDRAVSGAAASTARAAADTRSSGAVPTTADADARPPLRVSTPDGDVRPVGTRFAVQRAPQSTRVAVFDGAVVIEPARTPGSARLLRAGLEVEFDADGVRGAAAIARPAQEAWTRGVLLADGIRLDALAAELARYRRDGTHVETAAAVAGLQVFGSFPLREPDRVIAMLEAVLSVQAVRTAGGDVRLEARRGR